MFRTRYFRFLIIAAAAVAASCTADPVEPAEGTEPNEPNETPEPASLTLNISIADLGADISTRAKGDILGGKDAFPGAYLMDPNTPWPDLGEWTPPPTDGTTLTEDKIKQNAENYYLNEGSLIDGRKMSCLTLILINYHEDKIVGIRRIPDPDCPNHAAIYLTENQEGAGLKYPPTAGSTEEAEVKLNCILNEDGSLADVLRDINGKPVLDNDEDKHIEGLIGTKACVTFNYEDPKHIVDNDMLQACAKKLHPGNTTKQNEFIQANQKYLNKSAEKLTRGEYTILIVANYDHRVTTASAKGDQEVDFQTLNVDATLENLTNKFHEPQYMANGIPNFKTDYKYLYDLRFLMNRTLKPQDTSAQVDGQADDTIYEVVNLPGNIKPYIRPAVHQTLTAAKDIYLEAGKNVIDIELLRIASRTRVEVKNYSPQYPLKVHSLEFSKNYTQSTCYLFRRNKVDRDYKELATSKKDVPTTATGLYEDHDGKGAPKVDYVGINNYVNGEPTYGAIVPFIKDWVNKDKDGNPVGDPDGVTVAADQKRCIFDALMYESHLKYKDESQTLDDPDSFTYTIDVSYPDVTNYESPDRNKLDPDKEITTRYDPERATFEYAKTKDGHKDYIHNPTDVAAFITSLSEVENGLDKTKDEALCFLIKGVGSKKFLYEKDGIPGTDAGTETDINLDTEDIDLKSYLWVLELEKGADGTTYYGYLKNLRSGKYLSPIPTPPADNKVNESNCMRSVTKENTKKFELGVSNLNDKGEVLGEYSLTFRNPENNYYLSVWANGPYLNGYRTKYGADQGCQYRLYPIKLIPTLVYIGTPRFKKKVELTTFSDATGFVEKVNEIKRNDFIRILVEVSYNPEANDFDFKVNSWKTGGGDVAFH